MQSQTFSVKLSAVHSKMKTFVTATSLQLAIVYMDCGTAPERSGTLRGHGALRGPERSVCSGALRHAPGHKTAFYFIILQEIRFSGLRPIAIDPSLLKIHRVTRNNRWIAFFTTFWSKISMAGAPLRGALRIRSTRSAPGRSGALRAYPERSGACKT